jgi:membrane fusion protein (multidrug efflux system)
MTAEVRPTTRGRPRSLSETRGRQRAWWHYLVVAVSILALVGLAWGGYATWFAVTHVRATYARVSGLVVSVSAKGDARVARLLVRTGDQVKRGDALVALDNADVEAQVNQAKASLTEHRSALARAEADLEMTIRQSSASEQQAAAELVAAQARLAQAEAELNMGASQVPEEVRRATAQLNGARSNLARIEAGPRPQEIEQARADVAASQAQLHKATTTLSRMERLFQQGAQSEEALDAAKTDKQVAEAALTASQQKLSLLEAGSREEDIESARQSVQEAEATLAVAKARRFEGQMKAEAVATRAAEKQQAHAGLSVVQSSRRGVMLKEQDVLAQRAAVTQAQAALKETQVRLAESSLRSPVNGVVVRGPGQAVHEGEVVAKGTPIITIVSSDNDLWISGAVSELYSDRVREGQPVVIRLEAFPHRQFVGKVTQVGGATEFSTAEANQWMLQQVPIKASFNPGSTRVLPGMSCQMWVDVRKR